MKDQTKVQLTREQRLLLVKDAATRFPPIWTIYDHPDDVPGAFVVRCWYGEISHPDVFMSQELENARRYCLSQGADFCLLRNYEDDPSILESWI